MTAPEIMTNCPTDETLAAFIDGRLEGEARKSVVEHMATCAECRDLLLAAGEIGNVEPVARFTPRRFYPAASLAAAAAVAFVLFTPLLREKFFPSQLGVEDLVEASNSVATRPMEDRLSGGFAYKPVERLTRGKGTDEDLLIRAAASGIEEQTKENPTPENLHVLGMAYVLQSRHNEAIATLEAALIADAGARDHVEALSRSRNGPLLVDLSAAYQSRGVFRNQPQDYVAALNAAERAWSLEKTPEAAWNRAVAIDSMQSNEDAVRAWNDYLSLDRTSPWAQEALTRLKELN